MSKKQNAVESRVMTLSPASQNTTSIEPVINVKIHTNRGDPISFDD